MPLTLPIQKTIRALGDREKAIFLSRFFKTGPGQYAEGDRMLGLPVPLQRDLAKKNQTLPLPDVQYLLQSPYHEERLVALLIATHQFEYALKTKNLTAAQEIVTLYLDNTTHINNWDLVDLTAYKILGRWLFQQTSSTHQTPPLLVQLAHSKNLWERRIAIISTYYFLRRDCHEPTLRIATILLRDPHDLIHKAVGWMLREVGKKDLQTLDRFLLEHQRAMPRTALRYAIEKHTPAQRKKYLLGEA